MNDHGERMQLAMGVMLIICGIIVTFVVLIGGRRILQTLWEIAHLDGDHRPPE